MESVLLETIERAKRLKSKTPNVPDIHFQVLERGCFIKLDESIKQLNTLYSESKYQNPANQSSRLKEYKKVIRTFDVLENVGFSALTRCKEDDIGMCQLIQKICREINYPLQPPTVICLTKDYYCIYPDLNLLCVPLLEGNSLLHLPDLYHELAHPLLTERNNPKVEAFDRIMGECFRDVRQYFTPIITHQLRNHQDKDSKLYYNWLRNWGGWLIEFFCDIYAVCTIGPAFGWAHLYLYLKRGGNPYFVPTLQQQVAHPNDNARMQVILKILEKLGFADSVNQIQTRWQELMEIDSYNEDDNYQHVYPDKLLNLVAETGYNATQSIDTKMIAKDNMTPITSVLNQGWEKFVTSGESFIEWESKGAKILFD